MTGKSRIVIERIGQEQRELCPISDRCHHMAHVPGSPLYVFGKSPNEARKRYVREAGRG